MKSPLSNLSIHWSQRRESCVLDPSLFLSSYGLLLVQSLGEKMEIWIARELWHILDSPGFYLRQPEPIAPQTCLVPPLIETRTKTHQRQTQKNRLQVLQHWESYRARTPPTQLNLYWLGDNPGESYLPDGSDPNLIEHWEILARSLDQRLQEKSAMSDLMAPSFRDTAALAAVLGSAFILTCQPASTPDNISEPPEICRVLAQWGIPCQEINPLDAIATIERQNLLQLMVATGFSKYLWAGLNLAVLHLLVPSAKDWENARGYWYSLRIDSSTGN